MPDAILLLLVFGSAAVSFFLPTLLFSRHRLLNPLFGWHYVLVHDLVTDRPSRMYRCRQEGDRLLIYRRGRSFELVEKGLVVENSKVSWSPLTWSPRCRQDGDPKPRSLSAGLAERRASEQENDREVRRGQTG